MSKAEQKVRAAMGRDQTRNQLVRTVGRILPHDDCEDAAHDAFVQALLHAHQFRDDAQVSTWLHRIAFNAALVRQRSATRASRRLQRAQRATGEPPGMGAAAHNLEQAVASAEERQHLRAAVAQLPEGFRTVVERCVYQEQSPERVAGDLGITPSALRTRIMRARDRLRAQLGSTDAGREVARRSAYQHAA
jgi:RNA polymerase sigma-70 factor (ECF subfamily)